ncbi:hypothetical protein BYT27DRAFT_7339989 [Phlegmacium glaucopus]|nr:hypothetical protein BYT27DRAFT_7339989 [Phlegmacium glaucopus]
MVRNQVTCFLVFPTSGLLTITMFDGQPGQGYPNDLNDTQQGNLNHNNRMVNEQPSDSLSIIGQASRDMLFCSQNMAFISLFEENIQLKAELEAQRRLLAHLMEKDKASVAQRSLYSSSSSHPSSSSKYRHSSAITALPDSRLIIPQSSPQENKIIVDNAHLSAMGKGARELWDVPEINEPEPVATLENPASKAARLKVGRRLSARVGDLFKHKPEPQGR